MNSTPNSRARKAHSGKTQSQVFADFSTLSPLVSQAFLSPHDVKILVICSVLYRILKRTCRGSFGLLVLLSKTLAQWKRI